MPETPLTPWERDYRAATLAAIERRVREDGPHVARPDSHRARQFMPFAAVKGYDELTREREEDVAREDLAPREADLEEAGADEAAPLVPGRVAPARDHSESEASELPPLVPWRSDAE